MKKTATYIPLILYPYAYLFAFICVVVIFKFIMPLVSDEEFMLLFWGSVALMGLACFLYSVGVFIQAVYLSVATYRGKYDLTTACKILMWIKLWQIPAYLLNFVIGGIGVLLSIWGIGIVLLVVCVDLLSIIASGVASVGCSLRMKKEHKHWLYLLGGVGMFVYCIDVPLAIIYYVQQKRHAAQIAEPVEVAGE